MALALLIALALSISELLTKYRTHLLKNLVNVYLFIYLLLNALFASIAYWVIPRFTDAITAGTLEHSLLAGFGYALILRTKLMTVTIGKQELAVGPELLYTGLTNYVAFHLENRIRTQRDMIRQKLLDTIKSPEVFLTALNIKIKEISDSRLRQELETARDEILNSKQMSSLEKTYGVVRLLIEVQPEEKSLIPFLQGLQEGLKQKVDKTP